MSARASRARPFALVFALAWLTALAAPVTASAYEIVAWGADYQGQVSGFPYRTDYTAIAGGGWHSLALTTNGSIVAWGADYQGQVSNAPTGTGFTIIAGAIAHSLALSANGSIASWGNDSFGQVSNAPTGTGHTAIADGGVYCLALTSNGSIVAWGNDTYGQVSNAPPGTGHIAVAAGSDFGVALTANGSIVAWGNDTYGQLGNAPTGTGYTAIAARKYHALALTANGAIVAWGAPLPQPPPPGSGYTAIATGESHALALTASGSIAAWGTDADGEVSNTPIGSGFAAIGAGGMFSTYTAEHSLALRPPQFPGCPPSINCPAPNPSDPNSVARLVLFPGTVSVVRDNDPSRDLDMQCDVLTVANVPFPDDPFASFSGTLSLTPPTLSTPGELVVTQATIRNNTDPDAGVEGGPLTRGGIPLACGEFYVGPPSAFPLPGSLLVEIDGTLERTVGAAVTEGGEELEITGIGRTLAVPNEPWTPPAEVFASWINPGPAPSPTPMSASASKSGAYATGPGIIGLRMNIHLPVYEAMQLPTSINASAVANSIPSLSPRGALALSAALLGAGAVLLSRRGRARTTGRRAAPAARPSCGT